MHQRKIKFIFKLIMAFSLFACQRQQPQVLQTPARAAPSEVAGLPAAEVSAEPKVGNLNVRAEYKTTLEQALAGFSQCHFENMYIDAFTGAVENAYFLERKMRPCRINSEIESAYYCVEERFYGLPVYEIEIPAATAGFTHAIYINAPLDIVRKVLKRELGSEFRSSKKSNAGEAPELMAHPDDAKRSFLVCTSIAA